MTRATSKENQSKVYGKDRDAAIARLRFMAEQEHLLGSWSVEAARERCEEYGTLLDFVLNPAQTYSLAEVRDGTGWRRGVRFLEVVHIEDPL